MKRKIYYYYCMECDLDWESTYEETMCPLCHCGDIYVAEEKEEEDNEDVKDEGRN